jgi:RHH-type rel operon transcriptional repressor/antitoxin RelB
MAVNKLDIMFLILYNVIQVNTILMVIIMLLSVRVEHGLGERLEKLAQETHRPKSFYVKEALMNYLDYLEDIYIADKRIEDLRAGKEAILTSEEMWNDLEG